MTRSFTAKELLKNYFNSWIESTLSECKGRELACLIAIVRTADLHTLRISGQYVISKVSSEESQNISVGAGVLLPEILKLVDFCRPFKLEPTTIKLAIWAAKKLNQAGALHAARRLAAVEQYGLSTCTVDQEKSILIEPGILEDVEAHENSDRNWVNSWDKQRTPGWFSTIAERDSFSSRPSPNFNHLRDGRLVVLEINHDHFRIERNIQIFNALEYPESESFPDYVKLGPLTFGEWKHIAVCIAATMVINYQYALRVSHAERFREHGMLNLLGRFLDESAAKDFIVMCNKAADSETAAEILKVFSADENDAERCQSRYDSSSPMLVKVPDGYIFTQKGPIDNPYWYLVDKLKVRYPKQWQKNAADVTVREAAFQKDLYRLFSARAYAIAKENLKLKRADGSEATDIDAAVLELNTSTVYLFQLKWPYVYANDWRPRESRANHLRKDGEKWIEEVEEWLGRMSVRSPSEILRLLELQDLVKDSSRVQFRLIMLSRSWTRFSGKPTYNSNAAWISWTRLRRLLIQNQSPNAPLDAAWQEMCKPRPRMVATMRSSSTSLPNLTLHFGSSELGSNNH